MDLCEMERFSYGIGVTDQEMCYVSFILIASVWASRGGMDPATHGQTWMPPSTIVVHPHSRCPCYKHNSGMLTRPTSGVPDANPSSGCPSPTICRGHHILYRGINAGSQEAFNVVRHMYRLFGPPHQPCQFCFCLVFGIAGRGGPKVEGFGDADWDITFWLTGLTLDEGVTYNLRLEVSDRIGGMEVEGWHA